MREKHALEFVIEKMMQGSAHLFGIRTIFWRQESESVRFEVDERVADDQRTSILIVINRHFARGRSLDFDGANIGGEHLAILDVSS